jgi:hypothetical protein
VKLLLLCSEAEAEAEAEAETHYLANSVPVTFHLNLAFNSIRMLFWPAN